MRKRVLLHICCAPCSYLLFDLLTDEGYMPIGFFYNLNIHPDKEFERRKNNVRKMQDEKNLEIIYIDGTDRMKWESFSGSSDERCEMCYRERLKKTAASAKEGRYDYFTTSLLISPYQNHEKIKSIANEYAKEYGVKFLYRDFRKIFRESYNRARKNGIYTQKYCGCIVSLSESPFRDKISKDLGIDL